MNATRPATKLLTIAMAAVLLLPYTAPGVCGLLGRIGGKMEMSHDVATAAVQTAGAGETCCTVETCGVPHAAPPGCAVILTAEFVEVRANLPALPAAVPTTPRRLLTPPPKA